MTSCLEKCNEFARSKTARIFYGVFLVIICGVGIVRLLNASNQLQSEKERQSRLQLLVQPDNGLFYYKRNMEDSQAWKAKLDGSFTSYKIPRQNVQYCDDDNPPVRGNVCEVDLNSLGPCSPSNDYGIKSGYACVFLKLRFDPSWSPQYFNASELPEDIPTDMKALISENRNQKMIWLSCDGDLPADKENVGPILYFPRRGFRYSWMTADGPEPIVAINFERPTRGVVISVKCKLWAKNSDDSVSFQFLYD